MSAMLPRIVLGEIEICDHKEGRPIYHKIVKDDCDVVIEHLFYNGHGGKNACMSIKAWFTHSDEIINESKIQIIPTLVYEDLSLVKNHEKVLAVKKIHETNGIFTIKFRINEVSSTHQKQRFRLMVACSSFENLQPVYSSPISVRAKVEKNPINESNKTLDTVRTTIGNNQSGSSSSSISFNENPKANQMNKSKRGLDVTNTTDNNQSDCIKKLKKTSKKVSISPELSYINSPSPSIALNSTSSTDVISMKQITLNVIEQLSTMKHLLSVTNPSQDNSADIATLEHQILNALMDMNKIKDQLHHMVEEKSPAPLSENPTQSIVSPPVLLKIPEDDYFCPIKDLSHQPNSNTSIISEDDLYNLPIMSRQNSTSMGISYIIPHENDNDEAKDQMIENFQHPILSPLNKISPTMFNEIDEEIVDDMEILSIKESNDQFPLYFISLPTLAPPTLERYESSDFENLLIDCFSPTAASCY